MNTNNKIDVKNKALTGQRVIKITQNGEDIFLPVGLSSANPNGGSGGGDVDLTNLTAENIKTGITINGVTGTFTADADATSADILKDKTAYVNGIKLTGTYEGTGSGGGGETGASMAFYKCTEVDAEGWSGVLMQQDTSTGEWSATDTSGTDLTVRGYTPKVGKVYNQDTTVWADLYSNFFIQPFNVNATSYTGSPGSAVLYSYASGAAVYCSQFRSDWPVPPEGIATLPSVSGTTSESQQIGGDNYDTEWYVAWSGGTEAVLKGFQCKPGYDGLYGNYEFVLEGSASNSQTDSDWTTIATFTATATDYDKVIYYPVVSNNTAYLWYRIKVTGCHTHPYLACLASFTKDIGEFYYEK